MFGSGYTPQESAPQLPEGEYMARIVGHTLTIDEYNRQFVRVSLELKSAAGVRYTGYKPDCITLFDRPQSEAFITQRQREKGITLQTAQLQWDRRMTELFDAFRITRGDMNLDNWHGHTGFVLVRRQVRAGQPTGFMDIIPVVKQAPQAASQSYAAPAPQQAPNPRIPQFSGLQTPPPQVAPAPQQQLASPEFDDIPF